jgi:hypothetical protein
VKYWIPVFLLFSAIPARATTRTAVSCSQADVQTQVSASSNGDTVIIPACSQTNWGSNTSGDSPLSVSVDITIQGTGQGVTIIGDNEFKGNSSCTTKNPLINWTTTSGFVVRLTALTIVGVATDPNVCNPGHVNISGQNHQLEIDHITINPAQTAMTYISGDIWGVITTVSFTGGFVDGPIIEGQNWNGFSSWNDLWGDASWSTAIVPGGGQGIYIENSTFTSTSASAIDGVTDCFDGGQYTFRHNTVTMFNNQSHGADSHVRGRGCRWQEIYNNTYIYSNISQLAFISWIRGGSGVFFNNTVTAAGYSNKIVQVVNCRDASAGCGGGPSYTPWGACNGSGTNDENSTGTGYRCVDQPGAGTSCQLGPDAGGSTVTVAACSLNGNVSNAWTGNQLEPIYVWNNTLNGSSNNTTSGSTNETSGTDYIVGSVRPGYTPYTYPYPGTGAVTGSSLGGGLKISGGAKPQ